MPGNPYLDLMMGAADERDARLRTTTFDAVSKNPDEVAKARNTARFLGIPQGAAEATPDDAARDAAMLRIEQNTADAPVLRSRYTDADFAKLAHDDSSVLRDVERGIGAFMAGGVFKKGRMGESVPGKVGGALVEGAKQLGLGATVGVGAGVFDVSATGLDLQSAALNQYLPWLGQRFDPYAGLAANYRGRAQAARKAMDEVSDKAEGNVAKGVQSGLRSAGTNLALLPLGITLGVNYLAGTMATTVGAQAYTEAREKGLGSRASTVYALPHAVFEYAFERLPAKFLLDDIAKHTGFMRMLGHQLATDIPGEQLTTVFQDFNTWANLHPEKTVRQFIEERPDAAVQTLVATLVGAGVQTGTIRGVQKLAQGAAEREVREREAQERADSLDALFKMAEGSKLRERAPDTFAEFVRDTTQDANGEQAEVYVDGAVLQQTLEQSGIAPEDFAQLAPRAAAQLAEAAATGGDVAIPVNELVGNMAGSGLEAALLDHLRASPEALSRAEAKEASTRAGELFQNEAQRIVEQSAQGEALRASADVVKTIITKQLATANRFTADVNEAYSSLVSNFYLVNAQRLGVTPEQLYAQYPLQIAGEGVGALEQDTPAFKRWFGDSKVVDDKGRPLVVYHGTTKDFSEFKPIEGGNGMLGGFFFADKTTLEYADGYITQGDPTGANFMPVYLSIRNPMLVNATDDGEGKEYQWLNPDFERTQIALAQERGHDGLVIVSEYGERFYVAFRPEQIKSAIGNNGKFDPNNPSIVKQGANDVQKTGNRSRVDQGGSAAPLAGAPLIQGATGPDARIVAAAEQYAASVGIDLKRQAEYVAVDPERAARIASAYEDMAHAPQEPAVREAYADLIRQTVAQYRALEAAGFTFYFFDETNDPYDGNPWNAMRDLRANQRMAVFASEAGFGSGATELNTDDNPLLADTGITWPYGSPDGEQKRVLANDLFRAVHDAFGHGMEGAGFRADGEENAWQAHARLFTGPALGALTSETRGQNSWLNFGPYGATNRTAKVEDTVFADQKTGLMPEWTWTEGRVGDAPDDAGVFEQAAYFDATDTKAFKAWAKDLPVIAADDTDSYEGGGAVFEAFHGTTHSNIQVVDPNPRTGNKNGWLGAGFYASTSREDASFNYATEAGPDLSARIDEKASEYNGAYTTDSFARREIIEDYLNAHPDVREAVAENAGVPADFDYDSLTVEQQVEIDDAIQHEATVYAARRDIGGDSRGLVMPVWVRLEKPFDMRGDGLLLDMQQEPDADGDHIGEPTGTLIDFVEAINSVASQYDEHQARMLQQFAAELLEDSGRYAGEIFAKAVNDLNYMTDPITGESLGAGQIMQDIAREAGYDGFIMDADMAFGSKRRFGRGMPGINPDTLHIMPFDGGAQVKSATGNSTFDPNNPNIVAQGERTPRGTFNPSTLTTTLLQTADLSTFLHETGHAFLEMMARMAAQPGAPAAIQTDMATILEWFGVKDVATWQAMTLDQQRPYHEKFAESFEQYLFEGRAPSKELQPLFARFRSWLVNVYRSLTQFMQTHGGAQLTPEVRSVFDRMLATDDQIAEQEELRGFAPMFESAEAANMAPEEWAAYQRLGANATAQAVAQLQSRSLRELRWTIGARSRVLAELQKQAAEKRKAVEAEVRAEVQQDPVYAVQRWLKTGVLADGTKTVGAKLSTTALREMYGEDPAAVWRYLSSNMLSASAEDSLHPDVVAEMFGFDSGDAMVRAIVEAFPESQQIDGLTDRRMLERYGDLSDTDAMKRAADEAVHNEARTRFVATELRALQEATNERAPTGKTVTAKRKDGRTIRYGQTVNATLQAARQFAQRLVANRRVRDLKPGLHTAAETRAARKAHEAMAAGKTVEAITAKRDQLLNHYAAKETNTALAEIERGVKYLRKFENQRDHIAQDYLDQIDKLLERFDLKPSTTLRELDKRAALADWLQSQEDIGVVPDLPAEVIQEAFSVSYKNLTVEQFRGLVDSVKQIEHLGRLKDKLLTLKDNRAFKVVVDDMVQSITDNAGDRQADTRTPNTVLGHTLVGLKNFFASHVKAATWARIMDGGNDAGAVWNYIIKPANAAGDNEIQMRVKATRDLAALIKPVLKAGKMGGKGTYFASVDRSLNREAVLAIALNTGNDGNLQRLLDGEGWNFTQLQPVLESLSAQDWRFVQDVWDYLESYRPLVAEKEKRVSGVEPNWVEPVGREQQTSDGKTVALKGGYYPIRYDTRANEKAEGHADAEGARDMMRAAYTSATTRRSFTKTRAKEVHGRPLLYALDGLFNGVSEVIHDLSWHEFLIDANRLMRNPGIAAAMREHYGPEVHQQFKRWLQDVAKGDQGAHTASEQALAWMRHGVSIGGLGFNVMSAAIQPLGITQSMVRVGPKWVARGVKDFIGAPLESTDMVHEKSSFMRNRSLTRLREIAEVRADVKGRTGVRAAIDGGAYYLMLRAQQMVDIPTWIGAYEKATVEGHGEEKAVALADQAVIDAQGAGTIKDQSAIERGGPALKLFTTFYSFFNTAFNLGVMRTMTADNKAKLAADYLLLFTVPVVLGELLKAALVPGGDDGDDPKKLAKKLAGAEISYLMGLMFGVREFAGAVQAATGTNQYPTDYHGPAGTRLIADAAKLGKQVGQGEADDGLRKAIINTAGVLLRLPAAQINRSITGAQALREGKTQNPMALLTGYEEPK